MPVVEVIAMCSKEGFSHLSQKVKGGQDGPCLNGMRISALVYRRHKRGGVQAVHQLLASDCPKACTFPPDK